MQALNQTYFVYLLTNAGNSRIYTGFTSNLRERLQRHRKGTASAYTKKYRTTKLVYFEVYGTMKEATDREREIKSYSTVRKHKMVQSINPHYKEIKL